MIWPAECLLYLYSFTLWLDSSGGCSVGVASIYWYLLCTRSKFVQYWYSKAQVQYVSKLVHLWNQRVVVCPWRPGQVVSY